jgi:DNA (cytosine-5)-methyltransferase 1
MVNTATVGNIIQAADLFCGAGGTSTGLYNACHSLGKTVDLLAVNHWKVAIETHAANHPGARHICAMLEAIRPEDAVKSGKLDILVASPECTHHSIARGGRPVSDQMRASAWLILRWIEALRIENVLIENVREFRDWGPTGVTGKPLKDRKGETYRAFLNALRSFGYNVEDRILNAADYGDATARRRLFIMARKGNKKILWPESTHGEPGRLGNLKPYKTARDIIDWTVKGKSIFNRKKPLAPATLARIAAGLKKFGGKNAQPFLVMLYGTGNTRSVDRPLPTVTASGQHIGLAEPFLIKYHGSHKGKSDGENRSHDLDRPIPTLDTSNRFALVEPFLCQVNHTGNGYALIEPFIAILKGQSKVRSCDEPLPTITTNPHLYLCEPFLAIIKGKSTARECDKPLPAITTKSYLGLVEPFLVKYYGRSKIQSVDEPLDTITTKDRFGLVEASGKYQIDIRFRMLKPHELAAAMSLHNYQLTGTIADQVKQVGNAVPAEMAEALCRAMLVGER